MSNAALLWLEENVPNMGEGWKRALADRLGLGSLLELAEFIDAAYETGKVTPPNRDDLFKAFELTDLYQVKAVILGRDPYPDLTLACGLAFSFPSNDIKPKNSLKNILSELKDDLGIKTEGGDLSPWARNGVLLLNTALTYQGKKMQVKRGLRWKSWTRFLCCEQP